jgi:hypothetical protein
MPVDPQVKEQSIQRQTATKVAAMLVRPDGNPIDFWQNVVTLVRYYQTGDLPIVPTPALGSFDPNPGDAPPPHGDDDIPF